LGGEFGHRGHNSQHEAAVKRNGKRPPFHELSTAILPGTRYVL